MRRPSSGTQRRWVSDDGSAGTQPVGWVGYLVPQREARREEVPGGESRRVHSPVRIALLLLALLFSPITHALSISAKPPTHLPGRGDGSIVLYSYPHREALNIRYRKADGTYEMDALKQIAHVMRSPDGAEAPVATALIELIDTIQDTFKAEVVEVISGYRSPAYNAGLKAAGHHVARESLHTLGLAADIHLDEITEKAVRDFAVSLKRGGVGYYPGLNFVHVDLGEMRYWEEAEGPRKLVGIEANRGPCRVTTDRNVYFIVDKNMTVTIAGPVSDCGEPKNVNFEYGKLGQWAASPYNGSFIPKKQPQTCSIKPGEHGRCADYVVAFQGLPPGKYRALVTLGASPLPSRSNEFYVKKE